MTYRKHMFHSNIYIKCLIKWSDILSIKWPEINTIRPIFSQQTTLMNDNLLTFLYWKSKHTLSFKMHTKYIFPRVPFYPANLWLAHANVRCKGEQIWTINYSYLCMPIELVAYSWHAKPSFNIKIWYSTVLQCTSQ